MAIKNSCVHLAYLFTEVPFLDRFQAAADAGFMAVEFSDPRRFRAGELAEHASRAGLKVVHFTSSGLITALDECGYDGWVSCECFPSGPPIESLAWRDRFFGENVALGC